MALTDLPPALTVFLGALLLALVRGRARWVVGLSIPLLALAHAWYAITYATEPGMQFLGMALSPVHVHAATPAFATVFCLMLLGGALFALNQDRRAELVAAFVYGGGGLGVVFAGDLVTMLVFWEVMMIGSTVVIWAGGQARSYGAGMRYFALHAVGGVALMVGVIITIYARMQAGDAAPLEFRAFEMLGAGWGDLTLPNIGRWLVLAGMLVCAGAPPFSAWLADAYPEGGVAGSVFLSAFTTKASVFTLIVSFAGLDLLIWIGLWMAMYGIVYAMLENDIRRILAYSIVNQVGFMLVGVGVGTPLAIDGATAHAFAHIIYKGLLMMTAGSVLFVTGKRLCTEVGGLFRTMPLTTACAIIGALAISAFPLTSGFTTKTIINASVVAESAALAHDLPASRMLMYAWFLMEIASAGVFLHAGIKFPWFVFFARDAGLRPPEPPLNMRMAMLGFAFACIFIGVFPGLLYGILPYGAAADVYLPTVYSFAHVMEMAGLLLFSGLAFFLLLPLLQRKRTVPLDFDWIWRRFFPRLWQEVVQPLGDSAMKSGAVLLQKWLPKPQPGGRLHPVARLFGGTWAVGGSALMVLVLLLAYLIVNMVQPGWIT